MSAPYGAKPWRILPWLVVAVAGCSAPLQPEEPAPGLGEVEVRISCIANRVKNVAVTVSGPGSFILPVEILAEKFCSGGT